METKSTDRMFALIPLLGGLFAITYDVGYFWGVDPAFFSFFSLSEHVVFAAQAIPFAASLAVVMFLVVSWLFTYTENEARVPQDRTSMQRKSRIGRIFFWFFVIALPVNFIFGNYESEALLLIILASGYASKVLGKKSLFLLKGTSNNSVFAA